MARPLKEELLFFFRLPLAKREVIAFMVLSKWCIPNIMDLLHKHVCKVILLLVKTQNMHVFSGPTTQEEKLSILLSASVYMYIIYICPVYM